MWPILNPAWSSGRRFGISPRGASHHFFSDARNWRRLPRLAEDGAARNKFIEQELFTKGVVCEWRTGSLPEHLDAFSRPRQPRLQSLNLRVAREGSL